MENALSAASETDESTEELEPKFKYKRITRDLKDIVNKDVITACAVHAKFIVFGTFFGRIYLLDHQGNAVNCQLNRQQQTEFLHTVAVNEVDIDAKGEYVATCSDDGKVRIIGLFTDEHNQTLKFRRTIHTVALDPDVKSYGAKRFLVGDDKLLIYERNFLNKLKLNELCSAEGRVLGICWQGAFVAWASCVGVRVYDLNEKCSLGLIKWEEPINSCLENFRCNMRWADEILLIGWVDTVRVCIIRKRNSTEISFRSLPACVVDPISTFQTNFYISGLAVLTANELVILGYPKEKDTEHKAMRPVLSVIQYKLNDCETLCIDSLSIRGYQEYSVNDYILKCLNEENVFFIVAPKDVVIATLYDIQDRQRWLLQHRKYEKAMEISSTNGDSILEIARLYIDDLLSQKRYDDAAKVCLRVSGNDKHLWEKHIVKFFKHQQLRSLSAYLPTSEECKLQPEVYEMVLFEYLSLDINGFLQLIKEWQPNLYDCMAVINAIHSHFRKDFSNELLEALARLHLYNKDYENALKTYLKLQHKIVFDLIRRYDLYNVIHKMIISLIQLDQERAFQILLNKRKIASEIVVYELQGHQKYLYLYLDALDKVENDGTYHSELVRLYADYNSAKLLKFLKRSKHYPIQDALDICKKKKFYHEQVYLLGQMGNIMEALDIIIHKLNDVEMAIEFCKEYDDTDLWNLLINKSVDNPITLTEHLHGIIGFVNPEKLIDKIKPNEIIPNLRSSLFKVLWDYRLQVNIQMKLNNVQLSDYFERHAQLVQQQHHALSINHNDTCAYCERTIITKDILPHNNVMVFYCGHVYHEQCTTLNAGNKYCDVCTGING